MNARMTPGAAITCSRNVTRASPMAYSIIAGPADALAAADQVAIGISTSRAPDHVSPSNAVPTLSGSTSRNTR